MPKWCTPKVNYAYTSMGEIINDYIITKYDSIIVVIDMSW